MNQPAKLKSFSPKKSAIEEIFFIIFSGVTGIGFGTLIASFCGWI